MENHLKLIEDWGSLSKFFEKHFHFIQTFLDSGKS
jgi:hypothetical protein